MTVPEMIRIFFTTTLLKTGAHDRVGVRAAFFPVFGETLLILNLPCQHVFVRSRTDSVRHKPRAKIRTDRNRPAGNGESRIRKPARLNSVRVRYPKFKIP